MIALKEISKVICMCKYGVQRMGKAYLRKVSLRKGHWIREGKESIKSLKLETSGIFGSSFSHILCNNKLR